MTTDEEIAKRMIAAHWRHAARAKTERKREQHLKAVQQYTEKFPGLYGDGPARTHSGKHWQEQERQSGREWNLTQTEKDNLR